MPKGKGKGKGKGKKQIRPINRALTSESLTTGPLTSESSTSESLTTGSLTSESSTSESSTSESLTTGSLTSESSTSESLTTGSLTSESSTSESLITVTSTTGRRRRCAGDVVNLRFNPSTDFVLSAFVAGGILPCSIPSIRSGPAATAFISCLVANGFDIQGIVALTPTDVLVTLVRC